VGYLSHYRAESAEWRGVDSRELNVMGSKAAHDIQFSGLFAAGPSPTMGENSLHPACL